MKKIIFLIGLLLLITVSFQPTKAVSVDKDVGYSYTLATIDPIGVNYISTANPAPEVVYLGNSFVQLIGRGTVITYAVSWSDQKTIYNRTNSLWINAYSQFNTTGYGKNKGLYNGGRFRLDIGELSGNKIFSV